MAVQLVDQPSPPVIEQASWLWRQAEELRRPSVPYGAYLEDQRRGFIDTMSGVNAWLTVATTGNETIGLVGGLRPSTDRTALYVGYLAVDVARRRHGVGSALLSRAAAIASEFEAPALLLTVHESNSTARRLYEQTGWVATGRTESTPIDEELLVEYRLDLA